MYNRHYDYCGEVGNTLIKLVDLFFYVMAETNISVNQHPLMA